MSIDSIKQEYFPKYIANGEQKFYKSILLLALQELILIQKGSFKGNPPHIKYLDFYDMFIVLYRREGNESYIKIAKILRRAAHKIYRVMLKKNMTKKNIRFLNLI